MKVLKAKIQELISNGTPFFIITTGGTKYYIWKPTAVGNNPSITGGGLLVFYPRSDEPYIIWVDLFKVEAVGTL